MGRDLALERAWRDRIQQYEQSGLTIRQFCEREGLVGHQLSWWRRELKRRSAESDTKAAEEKSAAGRPKRGRPKIRKDAGFVSVQIEPSRDSTSCVEIILDQPPRIAVSPGFDAAVLREVIGVLEKR